MVHITWLGHSGFLLEAEDGTKAAIDPWTDSPTWPKHLTLEELDFVLVTHGHFDHAANAPEICNQTGATLVSNFEISVWAQGEGVSEQQVVGMNKGGTYEDKKWKFTYVKAEHSSGCPGPENTIVPGGEAGGFVIETPNGEVLYHAGDTDVFGDMQLIREMWSPTWAFLPIGGHFTMGPKGAAKAVELLGVEHVVPMHYGTFPALAGTPDQLEGLLHGKVTVHKLEPGESLETTQTVAA